VYFERRELPLHAEPVSEHDLREGEIYFALTFLDDEMLIPSLQPVVFIGKNLENNGRDLLYFQDAESYHEGVRFGSEGSGDSATFSCGAKPSHIFDYEHALNGLLRCSLRRAKAPGK
jgi:hypothetical protein